MKKLFIIIFLSILVSSDIFACLNGETKVLKDGTFLYEDIEGNVPYGHSFSQDSFEETISKLDSLYAVTNDLDYLSDKGFLLILQKKYDKAIKLYLKIEKNEPNRYSTASNIGTAYELSGQIETALKWIKKSVEIDPGSHYNSEWIHVRILEAKLKGEEFYTTKFLLNTEFGLADKPKTKMTKQELQKLSKALYYQLNERISFIKKKDKIVAQLLFDLGNIAFLLANYSDATKDYKKAKSYGFKDQLIEKRIKEVAKQQLTHKKSKNITTSKSKKDRREIPFFGY